MRKKNNKKAALHNLGCKVNAYETEAMRQILEEAGYEIVDFSQKADVYVVNTCSVTNMADRKSRQMLHRAKKRNPDSIVVAAGCYVQTKTKEAQTDPAVDLIVGNNQKHRLAEAIADYERDRTKRNSLTGINGRQPYETLHMTKTAEHTRAFIKVQDGCNQFCSYCIIPYARGRVRSRKAEDVLQEVRALAENGYQEIVLTGIHLSSFGTDTGEKLPKLLEDLSAVEGIRRIRLGSLEPRIITEDFVKFLSETEKVCPHFHLSLQSGCDATLKRMNRRYTSKEYEEKCALLRRFYDRPALTTDVIVGFPGETWEEFAQSKEFIDRMDFYETHVFKYSKRTGTKAAGMENQVAEDIKNARSSELIALGERKRASYEETLIGTVQEVLIEEEIRRGTDWYQVGHTREYVKVGQKMSENRVNEIVNVEIKNRLQIIH